MRVTLFGIRNDAPKSKTKQELEELTYPLVVNEYEPEPKLVNIEEKVYSKDWFEFKPTIKIDDDTESTD